MAQVVVTRLSMQDELANVVRGGATVVVLVWLYLAGTLDDNGNGRRVLLPYQILIATRPAPEQRMFRELQEGLLEAEALRSSSGTWPEPSALADDGIPPFAFDPTSRAGDYRWTRLQSGKAVNYLGMPSAPDRPAWLLLIQEPEPGIPPDQNFEDEEHHKLLDGTMLHVSAWMHTGGKAAERLTIAPQIEGWTQVYAVGPSADGLRR